MTTSTRTTAALRGGISPLAALTTIFTPPCPTSWLLTSTKLPSQLPPFPSAASGASSTCDPPFWGRNLASGAVAAYYSPAICPSGFAVGPSCGLSRTAQAMPPLASSETAAWCVPVGMTCTSDTSDFAGAVWGFSAAGGSPLASGRAATIGPAIQIRWAQADLSILQTNPLTPGLMMMMIPAGPETMTTASSTALTRRTSPRLFSLASSSSSTFSSSSNSYASTTSQPTLVVSSYAKTMDLTSADTSESLYPTNGLGPIASSRNASPTTVIVAVLITVLVSTAFWVAAYALFRRYRAGKMRSLPPALVRLGVKKGRTYRYDDENPAPGGPDPSDATTAVAPENTAGDGGRGKGHYGSRSKASPANIATTPAAGASRKHRSAGAVELEAGRAVGTRGNPAELDGQGVGGLDPERSGWAHSMSRLLPGWFAARPTSSSSTRRGSPGNMLAPPASDTLSSTTSMIPRSLRADDDDDGDGPGPGGGGLGVGPGFARVVIARNREKGGREGGSGGERPKSAASWKSRLRLSSRASWLSSSARSEPGTDDAAAAAEAPLSLSPVPPMPPMPPEFRLPMPAPAWMQAERHRSGGGVSTGAVGSSAAIAAAAAAAAAGPDGRASLSSSHQPHPLWTMRRSTADLATIHRASGSRTPTVVTTRTSCDTFGFPRHSFASTAGGGGGPRYSLPRTESDIPEVPDIPEVVPEPKGEECRRPTKSGSGGRP